MKKLLLACAMLLSMSVQAQDKCAATTKAGTPCSRKAVASTSYCRQHDPASARCGVNTKAGKPCSRVVKSAGLHCKQHSS